MSCSILPSLGILKFAAEKALRQRDIAQRAMETDAAPSRDGFSIPRVVKEERSPAKVGMVCVVAGHGCNDCSAVFILQHWVQHVTEGSSSKANYTRLKKISSIAKVSSWSPAIGEISS